jgi:hypothetical protein
MPAQNFHFENYQSPLEAGLNSAVRAFKGIQDFKRQRDKDKQSDMAFDLGLQDQILKMGRENVQAGGDTYEPPMGRSSSGAGSAATPNLDNDVSFGPITQGEAKPPRDAIDSAGGFRAKIGSMLSGGYTAPSVLRSFHKSGLSEKESITGMEQAGAMDRTRLTDSGQTTRTGMEQAGAMGRTQLSEDAATGRTNITNNGETARRMMQDGTDVAVANIHAGAARYGVQRGYQGQQITAANDLTQRLENGIHEVDQQLADPKLRASFTGDPDPRAYDKYVADLQQHRVKLVKAHIKALIGQAVLTGQTGSDLTDDAGPSTASAVVQAAVVRPRPTVTRKSAKPSGLVRRPRRK